MHLIDEKYYIVDVVDKTGRYDYEYWIFTYTCGTEIWRERVEKRTYLYRNQ